MTVRGSLCYSKVVGKKGAPQSSCTRGQFHGQSPKSHPNSGTALCPTFLRRPSGCCKQHKNPAEVRAPTPNTPLLPPPSVCRCNNEGLGRVLEVKLGDNLRSCLLLVLSIVTADNVPVNQMQRQWGELSGTMSSAFAFSKAGYLWEPVSVINHFEIDWGLIKWLMEWFDSDDEITVQINDTASLFCCRNTLKHITGIPAVGLKVMTKMCFFSKHLSFLPEETWATITGIFTLDSTRIYTLDSGWRAVNRNKYLKTSNVCFIYVPVRLWLAGRSGGWGGSC